MTKIVKFFMDRPTLFWSFMIGIIFMGILSYKNMPKLEDPAIAIKQASVIVMYPGADAHQVELDVAQLMEDELRTLPDVDKIKTECRPGQVMFNVEFQKETPMEEIEQHFDMLRRRVDAAAMKLPQGCMPPIVVDDMMDVYGLFYAFKGDGYTSDELERYAKLLRRELLTVKGVKRINIGGTQSEEITVQFTPEQLARNGLMPTMIASALQSATKTVGAGKVESGQDRFSVQVSDAIKTEKDIENLLIETPDGRKVRLKDLAVISRHYVSPRTNVFYVDGEPALTFMITLEGSAIVPKVGEAVDAKIAEVMKRFPAGIETEKIFFQPDKVNDAMSSFMLNLLESVLIVIVVLIFSMGWRSGLIIGFGLILTVALSFPILSMMGTTLQRISLGAFIVAMGMLVDNAVVIMDGILVDRQKGLPRDTYLYRIGRNVAMPLLGATIIAASTFLPIFLTPGSVGEFAGDLFRVIGVSLLVSWLLALIQVPVCTAAWYKDNDKAPGKDGGVVEVKRSAAQKVIQKILTFLIRYKWVSAAACFVLLFFVMSGMKNVRQVFFPDFDYKQFVAEVYFPPETNPDAVAARMLELSDSAQAFPGVDRVALYTGGSPGRYCLIRPMPVGGDNYAEFIVDCKDFKTMQKVQAALREYLRGIAPDAYIRTRKYNFSISTSHTVEVEFAGPDPEVLRSLSAQAAKIMRDCKWVDPYSVQTNWQEGNKKLDVNYSQEMAQRAGVNRGDVGNAISAATDGYIVGAIADQDKTVPVKITVRDAEGQRITDLNRIPVWSQMNIGLDGDDLQAMLTGSMSKSDMQSRVYRSTMLANVVDSTTTGWHEGYIYRFNGQRAIEVECDPAFDRDNRATPAKVLEAITPLLDKIQVPSGYTMRLVGENDTSKDANDNLLGSVPLMMGILLFVLLLLFNDWRKVTVIILCFPFVFVGIVPALRMTDTPFTFMAILGLLGLIGMMVKNAIVLVDEIKRQTVEEKQHVYHAIINATLSRVRPVLLASLTTVVGMIPLIPDPMYGSLAVVVVGGLILGTLVTLVLLPLLYSILFRVKKPKDDGDNAGVPAPQPVKTITEAK